MYLSTTCQTPRGIPQSIDDTLVSIILKLIVILFGKVPAVFVSDLMTILHAFSLKQKGKHTTQSHNVIISQTGNNFWSK